MAHDPHGDGDTVPTPGNTTGHIAPRLWTLPPSVPFLDRLADAVLDGTLVPPAPDGSAFDPADHLILLPTRRACRAFGEILLKRSGEKALLLPRIRPIGEVDEVDLALIGSLSGSAADDLDLPPAISPLRRQVLLSELVLAWGRTVAKTLMVPGRDEPVAIPVVPGDAAFLARDLATLIDDFLTEGRDYSRIATLAPADHAAYWQLTVAFLAIATEQWPEILTGEGAIDPADRRDRLLRAEAGRLAAQPPRHPVIAAGSTGTIPATAELLSAIARLPHGAVVLPGLDLDLDADSWAAIDEPEAPQPGHPQYGLKRLLSRLGGIREGVEILATPERPARERIVSEAFRPVATTDRWVDLAARIGARSEDTALDGLTLIAAASEQEEALAIALLMREALEEPDRRTVLVTPDRGLARRVAAELARWRIDIGDSAGLPLSETPAGALYRLIADAAAMRLAPVPLVALIQHPLAAFGLDLKACRRAARHLELIVLRGPRPAPGGAGLVRAIRQAFAGRGTGRVHAAVGRLGEADWMAAIDFAERIAAGLKPLEDLGLDDAAPLAGIGARHADALAAITATPDGSTLAEWDGDALLGFVDDMAVAAPGGLSPTLAEYPALLRALMTGIAVRPGAPDHPRLAILGPLEARLLSADRIILGGLVEGVWPSEARVDPFLNRPMRRDIGLEAPERFIGLAAHDVAQALAGPDVVLTHAQKVGGAPAVPSRWIRRLATVIGKRRFETLIARGDPYLRLARRIDMSAEPLAQRGEPKPRPPAEARPRGLRITEVETLIRDPYAIYARRILRLEPLARLDEAPDAADRGTVIHDALARYAKAVDAGDPANLIEIGADLFAQFETFPEVRAFWWPRFQRVAAWFTAQDRLDREEIERRLVEIDGRHTLSVAGEDFNLTGRADRFDILKGGTVRAVDYKTGTAPSDIQVLSGLSPQLPLEAAMALNGGFGADLKGLQPADLTYIELKGGRVPGQVRTIAPKEGTTADLAIETLARLIGLLTRFADPGQPYLVKPRAKFARAVTDYDHLSRWPEWGRLGGDAE